MGKIYDFFVNNSRLSTKNGKVLKSLKYKKTRKGFSCIRVDKNLKKAPYIMGWEILLNYKNAGGNDGEGVFIDNYRGVSGFCDNVISDKKYKLAVDYINKTWYDCYQIYPVKNNIYHAYFEAETNETYTIKT